MHWWYATIVASLAVLQLAHILGILCFIPVAISLSPGGEGVITASEHAYEELPLRQIAETWGCQEVFQLRW